MRPPGRGTPGRDHCRVLPGGIPWMGPPLKGPNGGDCLDGTPVRETTCMGHLGGSTCSLTNGGVSGWDHLYWTRCGGTPGGDPLIWNPGGYIL